MGVNKKIMVGHAGQKRQATVNSIDIAFFSKWSQKKLIISVLTIKILNYGKFSSCKVEIPDTGDRYLKKKQKKKVFFFQMYVSMPRFELGTLIFQSQHLYITPSFLI